MMRNTKIVCTLGPASSSEEKIRELILAGTDVFRLNFSHGDHASHRESIRRIRKIAAEVDRPIAILQDLQGPKIRLGEIPGASRELKPGEEIELLPLALDPGEGPQPAQMPGSSRLPIRYPWLAEDVHPGEKILLADGMVELEALELSGEALRCRVLVGGAIASHKGVNLPRSELRIPSLTKKDRRDLEMGVAEGVDMVALSFVRHEKDFDPVLEILARENRSTRPLLLAKIEKPQAVERLEAILGRVDAVMVARGDLGVEMPIEEVPLIQKRIIDTARRMARPVITATQMLRSMVDSPRPTRAEASDVANAILDGTDAVMLSEESAVGKYPVESVGMLARIADVTESAGSGWDELDERLLSKTTAPAIARAACVLARDTEARVIVAVTSSGSTARQIARFRPKVPVVGLTPSAAVSRQLSLSRGVIPVLTKRFRTTEEIFDLAARICREHGLAQPGEQVVVTAGLPIAAAGTTNLVHLVEI